MRHNGRLRAVLIAASVSLAAMGGVPALAADAAEPEAAEEGLSPEEEAAAAAIAEARANISITNAWTRATPGNATNAAVYLRIANIGGEAERLIGVRGEMSDRVMIHTGGGGQMTAVEAVNIPAEDTVLFEPNGDHIMLMGLRAPLNEDDQFLVQLEFERGGSQTVSVQVLAANALGPAGGAAADMTSGASE